MGLVYFILGVLQAEETALLPDALLLFAILALIMMLARQLDWYRLMSRSEQAP